MKYLKFIKLENPSKWNTISMTPYFFIVWFALCFVSCKGHVDEVSISAEKFKQYAVEAGVWDRAFMYDGHDFYTDIEWEKITEEDYNRWKIYIDNCVMWLENEKKTLKEVEFGHKLVQEFSKEVEGLSIDQQIEVYRKYNQLYPKYFLMYDDPVD